MTTLSMFTAVLLLRLLCLGANVVAIVFMVTAHQSSHVLNFTFTAKYNHTPAFKYLVVGEAIAAGYNMIAIMLMASSVISKSKLWRRRLIMLIGDLVVAMLLTSSISTALAVAEVGKHGNTHAGWLPICGQVPKFCDRVTVALVAAFAAAVSCFLLNLLTLFRNALNPLFDDVKPGTIIIN